MPLVRKPVAFDSIDFLPGFPTVSRFDCNPWMMAARAGACKVPPAVVGRSAPGVEGAGAIAAALAADSNAAPVRLSGLGAFARHHRRAMLAGNGRASHHHAPAGGCGCGGKCGGCGGGLGSIDFAPSSTSLLDKLQTYIPGVSTPMVSIPNWALYAAVAAMFFLRRRGRR